MAGVADRVRFLNQDLLATDIRDATVVMLFLSPELNLKARPKLLRELRPGTRVVSHWHDMGTGSRSGPFGSPATVASGRSTLDDTRATVESWQYAVTRVSGTQSLGFLTP